VIKVPVVFFSNFASVDLTLLYDITFDFISLPISVSFYILSENHERDHVKNGQRE
jgi:hypothetical protein